MQEEKVTTYQDQEWRNNSQRMLRELGNISNQLSALCTKMVQENKVTVKQVAALSLAISQLSTCLYTVIKRIEQ